MKKLLTLLTWLFTLYFLYIAIYAFKHSKPSHGVIFFLIFLTLVKFMLYRIKLKKSEAPK
ncbi:MAG: hypothetical protein RL095_481 [Verrucomicrobiota bacterium]|jgi:hypothetical protein